MSIISFIPSITCFREKYLFLSNSFPSPLEYDGLKFQCAESAYQAAKCLDEKERRYFIALNALEARRLGRQVSLRPDWETVKQKIMYDICKTKFLEPEMKALLLSTGTAELIEGSSCNDKYWGVDYSTGKGCNYLGKILMKIRSEFLDEDNRSNTN